MRWFVLLVCTTSLFAQTKDLKIADCTLGKLHARCGDLLVPEDYAKPNGRKIPIHFVVISATGKSTGAMFEIAGGPGVAPTPGAEGLAQIFAFALKDRDFVLVDQRGSGRSYPLDCGDAPKNAP